MQNTDAMAATHTYTRVWALLSDDECVRHSTADVAFDGAYVDHDDDDDDVAAPSVSATNTGSHSRMNLRLAHGRGASTRMNELLTGNATFAMRVAATSPPHSSSSGSSTTRRHACARSKVIRDVSRFSAADWPLDWL